MSDPSILVTNPSRSDPSLAPDGKEIYYVLFPTPEPRRRRSTGAPRARATATRSCARSSSAATSASATPSRSRTSRRRSTGRPAAWSAARRSRRPTRSSRPVRSAPATSGARTWSSPARAPSRASGVPMVLVSGRLAAERITGHGPGLPQRAPGAGEAHLDLRPSGTASRASSARPWSRSAPSASAGCPSRRSMLDNPLVSTLRSTARRLARRPRPGHHRAGRPAAGVAAARLRAARAPARTRRTRRSAQVLGVLGLLVGAAAAGPAAVQPRRLLVLRAGPRVRGRLRPHHHRHRRHPRLVRRRRRPDVGRVADPVRPAVPADRAGRRRLRRTRTPTSARSLFRLVALVGRGPARLLRPAPRAACTASIPTAPCGSACSTRSCSCTSSAGRTTTP